MGEGSQNRRRDAPSKKGETENAGRGRIKMSVSSRDSDERGAEGALWAKANGKYHIQVSFLFFSLWGGRDITHTHTQTTLILTRGNCGRKDCN